MSKAAIGRAFRRQAAKCHPDSLRARSPHADAANRQGIEAGKHGSNQVASSAASFVRLQQAYDLLLAAAPS